MFVFRFVTFNKEIKRCHFCVFFGFSKNLSKLFSSTVESVEKKDLSHHTKF